MNQQFKSKGTAEGVITKRVNPGNWNLNRSILWRFMFCISKRGATPNVLFTATLIATRFTKILEQSLLPVIEKSFPEGHLFYQDNDPKHTSKFAQSFFAEKKINCEILELHLHVLMSPFWSVCRSKKLSCTMSFFDQSFVHWVSLMSVLNRELFGGLNCFGVQ